MVIKSEFISLQDCPECSEWQGVIAHTGVKKRVCVVCGYKEDEKKEEKK
ncbi:hypothetical protein SAMN04487866_11093 [Thermoactinomyces sp. DSM 45891]|nr:hypothetical protein [Thermoactinomyces sp. DSM 45891]SFX52802.1 hypothetical protein SAMN04487866_11093 [Thermoactinomyces sp. DSM 45891]